MNNLFPEDSYDSPQRKQNKIGRLIRRSRFYFFTRLFINYCKINRCAKQGKFNAERQSYYSGLNFKILEECGGEIHLRGLNHLCSENGPFVLAGNHMSSIETSILNAVVTPRLDFTFVIKRSLLSLPFFGNAMRAIGAIAVDRVNARDDFKIILHEGQKMLQSGRSVLIFPESTRYQTFVADNFNSIAIKLARSANVKIIPFALKTDFLKNGKLIADFGPLDLSRSIHLEFGAPITIQGNGKEEHRAIIDFITEKLSNWQ